MSYYAPCPEFDQCNELIEKYLENDPVKCFEGHLALAEKGYPLAECQTGYFYFEGIGVERDIDKAVYWTRRSAEHGDRDAQFNLGRFYDEGIGVEANAEEAKHWYRLSALQDHSAAMEKCTEKNILYVKRKEHSQL